MKKRSWVLHGQNLQRNTTELIVQAPDEHGWGKGTLDDDVAPRTKTIEQNPIGGDVEKGDKTWDTLVGPQ